MAYWTFPQVVSDGKDHTMWLNQENQRILRKEKIPRPETHTIQYYYTPHTREFHIKCSCGWHGKKETVIEVQSISALPMLMEHAYSLTGSDHYTYYPQGV